MIYLASPYSDPDPAVRQARFEAAATAAAVLVKEGHVVYSPICHCHPIAMADPQLATDAGAWWRQNKTMLALCDQVIVVLMDGWSKSLGIAQEIKEASRLGIDVDVRKVTDL